MNPTETLETPAALVDLERLRHNLHRLDRYCSEHALRWRPHVKTHKTPELAAMQLSAGASGLTVATLREAEVMSTVADDLLLAYPPVGEAKLARLMRLPEAVRVTVGLDSEEALEGLSRAAAAAGREVGVLVELDVGMGRVGVSGAADAVALAHRASTLPGVQYRGVMFYPGHVRGNVGDQGEALRAVGERLGAVLRALRDAGLVPEIVSGGSTPTQWRSHEIPGLTEIRPGTSVFNDRTTAAIGACRWEECAYSVLATVVSTAVAGQAVIDAGSKALAKEELRGEGSGYGALLDRPEVVVKGVSEEHGILDLSETEWRPRVGDRVRVVPNHVCVSVNLQDRLWGMNEGDVVESWPILARGRETFAAPGMGKR